MRLDDWITVFRFVEWERQGARDFPGHRDSRARRQRGGIQELPMHGDEAPLGLRPVASRPPRSIEREL